jgi:hypothetical protein
MIIFLLYLEILVHLITELCLMNDRRMLLLTYFGDYMETEASKI